MGYTHDTNAKKQINKACQHNCIEFSRKSRQHNNVCVSLFVCLFVFCLCLFLFVCFCLFLIEKSRYLFLSNMTPFRVGFFLGGFFFLVVVFCAWISEPILVLNKAKFLR